MNKLSFPVLIVLYNPDNNCIKRIESLKSSVDFFIFDNSSFQNKISGVRYYKSHSNQGLSGAIYWMFQECLQSKHDYFLFFDQDTIFSIESIEYIKRHFFSLNSFELISHYSSEEKDRGLVEFVINSGTIFPINVIEKCLVNLKNYYVDCVDLSICLTAKQNNFQVISNWAPDIDHFSEQGYFDVNLKVLKLKLKLYPSNRRKEFYKSHINLLFDSILKYSSFKDFFIILKYILAFFVDQTLARLFYKKSIQ
jgi:GT2 family glycosyltransferase